MRAVLALLLAPVLWGQTQVKITQIRNWQQVESLMSRGTALSLDQVSLDPYARSVWKREAASPSYARYRAAVVEGGRHVVLITCQTRVNSCAEQHPLWFSVKPFPALNPSSSAPKP